MNNSGCSIRTFLLLLCIEKYCLYNVVLLSLLISLKNPLEPLILECSTCLLLVI